MLCVFVPYMLALKKQHQQPKKKKLQYHTGCCMLTPELLTAGGAIGRLMVNYDSVAGLRSLTV